MKRKKKTEEKFVFKITMYDNIKDEKRDEILKSLCAPLNVDPECNQETLLELQLERDEFENESINYKDLYESEQQRADNLVDENDIAIQELKDRHEDDCNEYEERIRNLEYQIERLTKKKKMPVPHNFKLELVK